MLVSILMITYNHEKYVCKALEGVLNQMCDFDFEVVLANDNSTDGSDLLIKEYVSNHPKGFRVKYSNHEKNKGMYDNFIWAAKQCRGKYIATCEGDDYWTDPLKLQKQVDFLEGNPEFEVCFTNIKVIRADGSTKLEQLIPDERKDVYEQKDLPIWAPTLTRVYKNRNFSNLPKAPGMDTAMLLWQSQYGKIKFLNEVTGTYRLHEGGIYSSQTEAKRKEQNLLTNLACLKLIETSLYSKYFGMLFKKLVEIRFLEASIFKKNKNLVKEAFQSYKAQMPLGLQFKIHFSFLLISIPFIELNKQLKDFLIKVLNRLFIY